MYGTVLAGIGRHKAIDMLEDREAGTLAAWLEEHPGIEVICRDRAGAYAEGARTGAPDAIQVADRWHLWHNLGEYTEKTVVRHRGCLKEPQPVSDAPGEPGQAGAGQAAARQAPADEPDGLRDVCGRERRLVARTRERHAAVHQLLAAGQSLGAAGRILSLDRKTVQRFARAASADELLVKATSRDSKLDPFKPHLNRRWNEGVTDAAALHAEIQAAGWQGSVQAVRRYVRPFRQMTAAPPPPPAVPKARQITSWLLRHPDSLDADEQAALAGIRARCQHVDSLAGHVNAFAEMMTGRQGRT